MKDEGISENNLFSERHPNQKLPFISHFSTPQKPHHSTSIGVSIPISIDNTFQLHWTHHSTLIGISISSSLAFLILAPKLPHREMSKQKASQISMMVATSLFLPCACIISALVSLMTGTSWTTIATIGIALLGIGNALSVPAHYVRNAHA